MTIFSSNPYHNSGIFEKQMLVPDQSDPKLTRLNMAVSDSNQTDNKLIHMGISSNRSGDPSILEQELERLYHSNIFGTENSRGKINTNNHKLPASGDCFDRWKNKVDYLDSAINQLNLENDLGVSKGNYASKSHLEYDNVCDSIRSMNSKMIFNVEGSNSTPKASCNESDKYIPLLMSGSTIATTQSASSSTPCEIADNIDSIENCASIENSFLPGIDYYRGEHSKFSGMNPSFVNGISGNVNQTDKHIVNQGKSDHNNSMTYLNEIFSSVSNTISHLSNIELSNSGDLPRFNNLYSNGSLINMAMQQSPDPKTVESHLNSAGSCMYDEECNLWFGNHTTPKKDSHMVLSNNYSFNGMNCGTGNSAKTYKAAKHLSIDGLNCQLGSQFCNQKTSNNYTEQDDVIGMITPISSRNSSSVSIPSESIIIANDITEKLISEIGCNGDTPDIDRVAEILSISLGLLGYSNLDNSIALGSYQNTTCLSQLCMGVGGPNFAAPTMLAHPDEFKNPSSFLKIYGDPLCCTVKGKGTTSINATSSHNPAKGQNGNWVCVKCSNVNFPRRFRCFKCNECRDESGDRIVAEYAKQVYLHHLRAYRSLSKQSTQKSGTNPLVATNGDSNNQINMLPSKRRPSQSGNNSLPSNSNVTHSLGTRKHNLSPTSPSFFPLNGKVYMRSSSENFASHLVNLPPPPPPPPDASSKLGYKQFNYSNRVRQCSTSVF